MKPTLLSLPPELWRLIGMQLINDVASLNTFMRLNYRAFLIGIPLLYQKVDRPEALGTLALPSSAGLFNRHTPAHPAGLVQSLELDFQKHTQLGESESDRAMSPVLQVKLQEAFANFAKYGARAARSNTSRALKTLKLNCPTLPFFEVFKGIDFRPFQLRELEIKCLAPSANMRPEDLVRWARCLATLIRPSLEQLTFSIGNRLPSLLSAYSSVIFRKIGQLGVNLRELDLSIPMPFAYESEEGVVANFNTTFASNEFFFPNLRSCSIVATWFLHTSVHLNLTPFLLRHPNLESLSCYIASGHSLIHGALHLPHLKFYQGGPHDWLAICNPSITPPPPVERLRLVLAGSTSAEIEGQVVESLERIAGSLSGLSITGHDAVIGSVAYGNSPRWLDVSFSHISVYERIFKACPCLRYLECHVNIEILEAGFIALIVERLPRLRILTLTVTDGRESCSISKAEEVLYNIWEVLRGSSAALPLFMLSRCSVSYYLHSEPSESQASCKVFAHSKFCEDCVPRLGFSVPFD
ncbi:hypothetical protein BDP27DRAFT_1336759 [Rhodocollybia butyracea]|uniref:Uncharacterized protein n=1 Tax=Rhodocollybia butyracea TaxID=206335 RepID=A0A9P5U0A2_9AGAR|nr:hypothetical protein BDP27DRAFT_1336759 [Rhodocollybia butyracea]